MTSPFPTIVMLAPVAFGNFSCASGNVYVSTAYGLIVNPVAGDIPSLQTQGCTLLTPRNQVSLVRGPASTDDFTADFGIGSQWTFINAGVPNFYICIAMGSSPGTATWTAISSISPANPSTSSISGSSYTVSSGDNNTNLACTHGAYQTVAFPSGSGLPTTFRCYIYNANTGAGVYVTGLGNYPGTAIAGFILWPGQGYTVFNNGGTLMILEDFKRWVLPAGTTTFYASTTGVDTNDGLSSSTPTTAQTGIFNIVGQVDQNHQNIILQLADGTYTTGLTLWPVTGWGTLGGHSELIIRGNLTTPTNCNIAVTNSDCFSMVGLTTPWRIEGFHMTASGSPGNCVACDGGSFVYIGNNNFGVCTEAHLSSSYFSFLEIVTNSYTISGGAAFHYNAFTSSLIDSTGTQIVLTGTPAFSTTFVSSIQAIVEAELMNFVGTATGARYGVINNGVINSGGGGSNYFPGNVAGSASNGGFYG